MNPDAEESLLREVLGGLGVPDHTEEHGIDAAAQRVVQDRKLQTDIGRVHEAMVRLPASAGKAK
jgi:hypothetical protein